MNEKTLLYQITETSNFMMSFVLVTKADNVIVIDGGSAEDMPLLKQYVGSRHISAWILTHPHNDHIGGISAYESVSLFEGNNLTVGVDWQHFGGKAWNRNNNGTEKTLADTTQNEIGAYIDIRQQATRWLTVNGGLRIDWHSHAGTELVPQLGVAFHPTRNDDLKVIAGKGFRNPTIRELYMFRSANPTLHPEKMMNYEVSYSHRLSSHGSIGAN